MKMDAGYDKMNIIFRIFCVYDEPSADSVSYTHLDVYKRQPLSSSECKEKLRMDCKMRLGAT